MERSHLEWISDEDEKRIFQKRVLFVLAFIGLVFLIILLRMFTLQIIRGNTYLALSERNRIKEYRILPSRGLIFDRNGKLVVDNRLGFDLLYNLASRKRRPTDEQLGTISSILKMEPSELRDAMKKASIYKPARIAMDIEYATVAALEEAFNIIGRDAGFEIQPTHKRNYRYPQVIPHFLGHMGEVNVEQLTSEPDVYREGDLVGKSGIERALESSLRGEAGQEWVEENAFHQRLRSIKLEPAKAGKNVYLTIDLDLNLKLANIFGERAGAAIVMSARTGSVLAAHSSPTFDPSIFGRSLSLKTWQQLESDPSHPLLNKVISGLYPPGSVFKPVVALAALKHGVLTPEFTAFCPGLYRLGKFEYRCWKRSGHGLLNLHRAIVESCDVYFYRMAEMTGIDRLAEFAQGCGFGRKTGIEIAGEKSGLVPSRKWKKRAKKEPWLPGETVLFGIGQGYVLATPLQVATFYCALANGGRLLKPKLVEKLEDPASGQIEKTKVETTGRIPADERHLRFVNEALLGVTEDEAGTGKLARVEGIRVAGKTGTAQVTSERSEDGVKLEDHAWFAAFAPFEHPEICVVVLVEHGGKGGSVAAPIAGEIMKEYFGLKSKRTRTTTVHSGKADAED